MDELAPRALASISQGVVIAARDQRITYTNDAFLRITGYAFDDVVGRNCRFLQGADTDRRTVDALRAALANGADFAGEILNYRKDGTPFWNELIITPVRADDGALSHFIGVVRDASARKAAEAARDHSNRRFEQLVENIPAGIVVHDPQTAVLFANASASRLLGTTVSEMIGLRAEASNWAFFNEDGSAMAASDYPVNRVLAVAGSLRDCIVGIGDAASSRARTWVLCNAFPVLRPDGGIGEVVVTFTDVTTLKQAEDALKKSEERLRLVLKGSNDAPWDWDVLRAKMYYSERWWLMLGLPAATATDDPLNWMSLLHADDQTHVREAFADLQRSDATTFELEFRLRHAQGHYVPTRSRGLITRDAAGRPLRIAGTNTDLTAQKRSEERIHQLAYFDGLTELPNRRFLLERLEKAIKFDDRHQQHSAALFINLDNFKRLNDTLGHHVGDELLRQVASRLKGAVRASDTIGRLGGDEFLVLLEELGHVLQDAARAAEIVATKILAVLGEPYLLFGRKSHSTPSIGIALFDGLSDSVETVLKQADLAMYQAKAKGGGSSRFFDASMQASVDSQVALERDLRDGMDAGQLRLHLQVQVDSAGAPIGAEALVRWAHPQRGLVSPAEFIPMAESTGLIHPLGRWVLQQACERLHAWQHRPGLDLLTLSVNVSARQIHDPMFVDLVTETLARTGADPRRLKLELTESVMAINVDDVIAKMVALRAAGVGIAMDDFGTGYSSLSYLKHLPLDQLKIDQSFVRDVLRNANDAAIANVIISLGHRLGLTVVAEGVETPEQLHFLRANGCLHFQGYLFGRPKDADLFEAEIDAGPG